MVIIGSYGKVKREKMKYRCIKKFQIPLMDEDYFTEIGTSEIPKNSIWEKTDDNYMDGEIHLESDGLGWIEISKETFNKYFEKM